MNSNATYAFYGSLRRGMSNYKIYEPALEYINTVRLPGFRLYALPNYPFAVRSADQKDVIVAELFKVTSNEVEHHIHSLELRVGYYYDEVSIEGMNVGIYLYESVENHPLVEHGDWVHFFGR
jgi:gamma-glutamylcyclotransferase (GGCT)/AIG2-like uncharacterized protein YtfP